MLKSPAFSPIRVRRPVGLDLFVFLLLFFFIYKKKIFRSGKLANTMRWYMYRDESKRGGERGEVSTYIKNHNIGDVSNLASAGMTIKSHTATVVS